MCAAAITRGDIMVQNVIPKHLEATSAKLIELGCEVMEFLTGSSCCGQAQTKAYRHQDSAVSGFPLRICSLRLTVTLALAGGNQHCDLEHILRIVLNTWTSLPGWAACVKVGRIFRNYQRSQEADGRSGPAPDLRGGEPLL